MHLTGRGNFVLSAAGGSFRDGTMKRLSRATPDWFDYRPGTDFPAVLSTVLSVYDCAVSNESHMQTHIIY